MHFDPAYISHQAPCPKQYENLNMDVYSGMLLTHCEMVLLPQDKFKMAFHLP